MFQTSVIPQDLIITVHGYEALHKTLVDALFGPISEIFITFQLWQESSFAYSEIHRRHENSIFIFYIFSTLNRLRQFNCTCTELN